MLSFHAEFAMRMMFIGAHPDDGDIRAGGLAAQTVERGGEAVFVSISNGNAGHHEIAPQALARRRKEEADRSAATIGAEYIVLDHDDGRIQPTLDIREDIIRLIRRFHPDLLVTLRPVDYHADHRAAGQVVVDASYLLTVPHICPDVPAMKQMPVIVHGWDRFRRPIPFQADIALSIDDHFEKKIRMIACHESQFFEWIPYNGGYLQEVPEQASERLEWLSKRFAERFQHVAESCRDCLIERYGPEEGAKVRFAEAFELCEYGRQPDEKLLKTLFPG